MNLTKKQLTIIGIILLIMVLVLFAMLARAAYADPFLVCDPQPNVEQYVVTFDGIEEIIAYQEMVFPDGTHALLKDLAGIAEGNHSVSVKARNMWGESASVPFTFDKIPPGAPTGIKLNR